MSDREEDERRTRHLTSKGQEIYIINRDDYISKLQKAWEKSITTIKDRISGLFEAYTSIYDEFTSYLHRQNTDESTRELERALHVRDQRHDSVKQTFSQLDRILSNLNKKEQSDTRSQASSRKSHSSTSSKMSDTIARKRAKAQAARVNMEYAEKEFLLQQKRAELDAELNVLSHRKLVAAAEAECEVLERESGLIGSELTPENLASREHQNSTERTAKYLQDIQDRTTSKIQTQITESRLDPDSQPFIPTANQNNNGHIHYVPDHGSIASDLTRFLLKKDLLLSRLTNFDDQPETFLSWKSSFRNILKDLEVNSSEEIDLLVKYLGQESSKYALNIRTAHSENPRV